MGEVGGGHELCAVGCGFSTDMSPIRASRCCKISASLAKSAYLDTFISCLTIIHASKLALNIHIGNVLNIPLVSIRKALPQGNSWLPAHGSQARNVKEFLRHAIRLFSGVAKLAGIVHNFCHRRCQLGDSQVLAPANVDLQFSEILTELPRCIAIC
jgi:hypothetical protein